jgi:hypothetical protein
MDTPTAKQTIPNIIRLLTARLTTNLLRSQVAFRIEPAGGASYRAGGSILPDAKHDPLHTAFNRPNNSTGHGPDPADEHTCCAASGSSSHCPCSEILSGISRALVGA